MGYGTGVLRSYFLYYLARGMTVGVVGTASLFVARKAQVRQSWLIASRGVGMIVGPMVSPRAIGQTVESGEIQLGAAAVLMCKAACALAIPRTSSPLGLYLGYFLMGVTMSVLDTLGLYLVGRYVGTSGGTLLSMYDACYGIGGMIAPLITVAMPDASWDVLATVEILLVLSLAGRRVLKGKPRDWEAKSRLTGGPADLENLEKNGNSTICTGAVPQRVLRVGVAFTFLSQIASTSVSAWGFTFASSSLGFSDALAALLPSTFYFSSTLTRFVVALASMRFLPSAVMQASVVFLLVGACFFRMLTLVASPSPGALEVYLLLSGVALMGAGCCPHYSFMMVSMAQHGTLRPREQGWYSTSVNLGVTAGMLLPSLAELPNVEMACALGLAAILNSHVHDFPWGRQGGLGK